MKKCFYLVIMMLVSISANADDYFKHGGIRYKIESFVDQELRVTYILLYLLQLKRNKAKYGR